VTGRKRESAFKEITGLLRAWPAPLSGMLDHKRNNAAINQCFSAKQSRFAGARIVRRSSYEIKSACDATRAACRPEIGNISTDI
jgi:hypothetical protein